MKPGQTVYYTDQEGAAQKAIIDLKKTRIVESKNGKTEVITYTLEGKGGEYTETELYKTLETVLSNIVERLEA